ncbi:MAG: hypothetical protein ACLFQK_00925 [Fibrobacterota bacterium]
MPEINSSNSDLYIIDGIGPFYSMAGEDKKFNWSKISFPEFEKNGLPENEKARQILKDFESFALKVSEMGYNSVILDDLAHLANYFFYPESLRVLINYRRKFFKKIFTTAAEYGLKVFLTTDIMFFNYYIENFTGGKDSKILKVLLMGFAQIFEDFPEVAGFIVRIGESDGVDVQDDFKSRLIIKDHKKVRKYLRFMIPLFEKYNKLLIFRTWTVGAYPIGDLIWNKKTFRRCFSGFKSSNFIISIKFGETDFFRYLELNPTFFETGCGKIIELQSRREYEGFGEFFSYTGYDYCNYREKLKDCKEIRGMSVWCQTGGWSHFNRLTFLQNSSLWNEINTFTSIKIFRDGLDSEDSLREYSKKRFPGKDPEHIVRLAELSDRAVKKIWYMPEYSRQRFYFRRLRIPPLIWVFWDTIIINHTMRKVLRRLIKEEDRKLSIKEAFSELENIKKMRYEAEELGLDTSGFDFMYDTFFIIALAREYFLETWNPEIMERIDAAVVRYREKYPDGFRVEKDYSPFRVRRLLLKALFWISLRKEERYRWVDRVFLIRVSGWIFRILTYWKSRNVPAFARKQAMGINHIFK